MHPKFGQADRLSFEVIGSAIEVHRIKGPGLLESIYQKCLERELTLRGIRFASQMPVKIDYKGFVFDDNLRVDLLVNNVLIVELKAVEEIHPIHKAQVLSYMRILDVPLGLIINFHKPVLKDGISRLLLPEANQ